MHRVHFDKGFKPQDLLNGVEFEIDQTENESDDDFYDPIFDKVKDGELVTELNVNFDDLRPNMIPVTEDGGVMKQIMKVGIGVKIPEKSVIVMHYDAFLKNQKEPFDSTRIRGRPHKFLFGEGNIIPGLEMGIRSMKKCEMARILISPEYGYGEMGCPPRIPGNAEILYVVEIINIFDSKDAIEYEEMSQEEQRKASFEKIVAVFHCDHEVANDLFRHKHYRGAIARYRKMVKMLEDVSVENEEQDEQRKKYLIKLYLNLSLCYININVSDKAIIYGLLGYKLDPNNPKALFRVGCAYLLALDFEQARKYLLKAKKLKPFDLAIQKAVIELENKQREHIQWEKGFCERAWNNASSEKEIVPASSDMKEFRNVLEEQFKKFVESDEKELSFSSGYSDEQIDIVKELATVYDVAFVAKTHNQKIIKVVKKVK